MSVGSRPECTYVSISDALSAGETTVNVWTTTFEPQVIYGYLRDIVLNFMETDVAILPLESRLFLVDFKSLTINGKDMSNVVGHHDVRLYIDADEFVAHNISIHGDRVNISAMRTNNITHCNMIGSVVTINSRYVFGPPSRTFAGVPVELTHCNMIGSVVTINSRYVFGPPGRTFAGVPVEQGNYADVFRFRMLQKRGKCSRYHHQKKKSELWLYDTYADSIR